MVFVKVVVLILVGFSSAAAWSIDGELMNVCDSHELETKNCHIQLGTYKLHVRSKKIHINNGTWREVEPMPELGEKAQWQSILLRKIGRRPLVELLIWDTPMGEAKISGLQWLVFELKKAKWHKQVGQVIQKRRHLEGDKYFYDKKSDFGLKPKGPTGHILWHADTEQGSF